MIKGKKKSVYIIKNTGSRLFEEAIFIVKKDAPHVSGYTLKQEAEKVIVEKTSYYIKKALRKK